MWHELFSRQQEKKLQVFRSCPFFIRYSLTQLFYTRLSDIFYSLLKFGLMTKMKVKLYKPGSCLCFSILTSRVSTLTFYPNNDIFSNPFTFVWSTKIHQESWDTESFSSNQGNKIVILKWCFSCRIKYFPLCTELYYIKSETAMLYLARIA